MFPRPCLLSCVCLWQVAMEPDVLLREAKKGGFFSYACGTVRCHKLRGCVCV